MSQGFHDEDLFAASLRERFPEHADRVMAKSGLPIREKARSCPAQSLTHSFSQTSELVSTANPISSDAVLQCYQNTTTQAEITVEELVSAMRSLRHKKRLTQREFADQLGVSPRTLQDWEQERRLPSGPAKALLQQRLKEAL